MNEGDVVLAPLVQADGQVKNRPAVVLRSLPPFGDLLVCGVSSQLHREVAGFDDVIAPNHGDFQASGLKSASLIRLGYLGVLPRTAVLGRIGTVAHARHRKLLQRLSDFLIQRP